MRLILLLVHVTLETQGEEWSSVKGMLDAEISIDAGSWGFGPGVMICLLRFQSFSRNWDTLQAWELC